MPAAAPPFAAQSRTPGGLSFSPEGSRLRQSRRSRRPFAGFAGSAADEIPEEKLNPEGFVTGQQTKVKNPPQKPGRRRAVGGVKR